MSVFFFPPSERSRTLVRKNKTLLNVESLEERSVPTCSTISGFVYHDANNNGLFDTGESPIASSKIELRDANNVIVASATTDANGRYEFMADQTVDQTPQTMTKTVEFPVTQTNFNLEGMLDQFDPALGDLKEVQITHSGAITSEIKVENTSLPSGSPIAGTVSGHLTLVAPGVNDKLTLSEYAGQISAQSFDGIIDFKGTSGTSFGKKTADGSNSVTLTGAAVQDYVGTGKVKVTEQAVATSRADGGGNLVANIESTGLAKITVKYKFVPNNCIKAGNYTIIQTEQPPTFVDGKESKDGVVIPGSIGTDRISITVTDKDAYPNNNFGELKAAKLSGHVYFDSNNDGKREAIEMPIPGTTVELTGFDDLGPLAKKTDVTDAGGSYSFDQLRPGTYTITEKQPAGFSDGKDSLGSLGGTLQNDAFLTIAVASGNEGTDYDFGEIKPSEISGHVYVDRNDNGKRETGEEGIQGAKVTLTGTLSEGGSVNLETVTDAGGFYRFDNLKPGIYTVTETQPVGYDDGKDSAGSLGGDVANDVISNILIGMGQSGVNYDFGEKARETSDLGIVKSASASVSKIGDPLTYTLIVTNFGAFTAQGVRVTDTLPAGVIYRGTEAPAGWSVSMKNGVITAIVPSLAVGASAQLKVSITVPMVPATLTNVTEVTSTTPDSNPNNNKSTVTTTVITEPGTTTNEIRPLVTSFGMFPVISKNQLFNVDPLRYLEPTVKGQMTFVDGVYKTLTGGSTAPATNLQTVQRIRAGVTRSEIVSEVSNSDAHRIQQANTLFQTYYHRAPTSTETAVTVQTLRTGTSELKVAESMLSGPLYQQLHPNAASMAAGLQQDILGKTPDLASQNLLLKALDERPLGDVVQSMLYSNESLARIVDASYRANLRRVATSAEIAQWTPALKNGSLTPEQLGQRLLATDEFYQLAFNSAR